MIPEADGQKAEQKRLDPRPVPKILMQEVNGSYDENKQRPLPSDSRSALFCSIWSHSPIVYATPIVDSNSLYSQF